MPRNSSGVMALPAGNPVIPGTLIESTWANPTMADLANEITLSLPRNGAAGMTGPLILARDGILPKEAVTVSQIESAITGNNSYLPAGAIQTFAFIAIPTGWLECNGAEVSRTTYANLFAHIGITFGAGNGTTTFNLPDLRGMFVRGYDNGRSIDPGRLFGSVQQDSNRAHGHAVSDPGHSHAQAAHSHTVGDPGHSHTIPLSTAGQPYDSGGGPVPARDGAGISSAASGTGISLGSSQPAISSSGTGVGISSEGTEGRPKNVAMVYCIKAFGALQTDGLGTMAFQNKDAVDITGGSGTFATLRCTSAPVLPTDVARLADIGGSIAQIYSSDTDLMVVDNTTPSEPILRLQSNVPNGMAKLGPGGQIPPELINLTGLDYVGPWDASTGLNPSEALPLVVWNDGDFFEIEVAGTLTLINSSGVAGPILVGVGDSIVWMDGSPAYVTAGWYYQPFPVASSLPASSIAFSPTPEVSATDVQAAIEEVAEETVRKTPNGKSMEVPVHTTAERGAIAYDGYFGYNSDIGNLEVYRSGSWQELVVDASLFAPAASPNFTGTVTLPQTINVTQPFGVLQVGGVDVVKFDAGGIKPLATQDPCFGAWSNTANSITNTGLVPIVFDQEEFDVTGAFDPVTQKFQPQVAGYYQFNVRAQYATNSYATAVTLLKNGAIAKWCGRGTLSVTGSAVIFLNGTSDYVQFGGYSDATQNSVVGQAITYVSGFLVRRAQ